MAAVILLATALPAKAAVVRQPYLQLETPTSITLVWRTDTASDSRPVRIDIMKALLIGGRMRRR